MRISETSREHLIERFENQRVFFATQKTKDLAFRIRQLKALKASIKKHEKAIEEALWSDLHKSPEESYLTEISIVLNEIDHHLKHVRRWSKRQSVSTPLHLQPSRSYMYHEPLGVALIIAPWNYPFQLLFNPLVGAISAGCCVILKPSPDASATVKVMQDIIEETFNSNYIAVIQGGIETNTHLLKLPFDSIFFTGSTRVGKIVMKAAAEHLTPVILELGGKSPCIVDETASIKTAAKRIIWGKLLNAGQTCIAPDYLLVHASVKEALLSEMVRAIQEMFGQTIKDNRYYPRIINERAFDRLSSFITQGTLYYGGETDCEDCFIQPTILTDVDLESPIMQEEIFGPILPVLTYNTLPAAIEIINSKDKPLAFYYFGNQANAKATLKSTTSGGGCINDTIMHIANHNLPFGGVGSSGLGNYHGHDSFLAFTNRRSIVETPTWIDLPFKYAPYKFYKFVKKII